MFPSSNSASRDDLRSGAAKKRLSPIFRDEADLAGSASLSHAITEALTESSALIVIGSPAAANSDWVDQEILAFKRLGRSDRIFCLIVDGEPFASDRGEPDRECFPRALRYAFDPERGLTEIRAEPLGVDLRKDGKRDALLRVAAGLLGVGFDRLKQRELRRRQRQLIILSVASVIGMAVTSTLALMAYRAEQEAHAQRQTAEREAKIARETTSFLLSLFQNADPFRTRGQSITAREVLDAGLTRIRTAFPRGTGNSRQPDREHGRGLPGTRALQDVAQLFDELEQSKLTANLDPLRRLRFLNSYAETSYNSGDYAKAKALMYARRAAVAPRLHGDRPGRARSARNIMSLLAMQDSDAAAAEVLLAKNLEELSPSSPDTRLQRALSYFTLGMLKVERQDDAGALAALESSLALRREALGDDHPWVAEVENALALADYNAGSYLEAERRWQSIVPSYRKYFGDEHPEYSNILQNYALTVAGARQFRGSREALPPVRRHRPQGQGAGPRRLRLFAQLAGAGRTGARPHARGQGLPRRRYRDRAQASASHAHAAPHEPRRHRLPRTGHEGCGGVARRGACRIGRGLMPTSRGARRNSNVALFCAALVPGARPDLQPLLAGLPEIDKHWGKDRLYAREARWRIRQAFARPGQAAARPAVLTREGGRRRSGRVRARAAVVMHGGVGRAAGRHPWTR